MAEPRYGYNAAGQWTILQPGEAEWNPATALSTLYKNDTSSLLGQYFNAGGNVATTGGLLSNAGAVPKTTSVSDIVYNYTRPFTSEEYASNLNDQSAWKSSFMNSPLWNPGGTNDYAIQNEPLSLTKNTVSDSSKWNTWASDKGYIEPTTTTTNTTGGTSTTTQNPSVGTLSSGTQVINNSSEPVRIGGGIINNSVFPTTSSNYKPETILQPTEQRQNPFLPMTSTITNTGNTNTTNSNTTSPYLSRVSNNMAYSGAPRYNDVIQTNNQANTGLAEATKAPSLGTPTRGRNTDFSKALWR